jgi:hypothetical protein
VQSDHLLRPKSLSAILEAECSDVYLSCYGRTIRPFSSRGGTAACCVWDHSSKHRQVQRTAESGNRSDEAGNGIPPSRRGRNEAQAIAKVKNERCTGLKVFGPICANAWAQRRGAVLFRHRANQFRFCGPETPAGERRDGPLRKPPSQRRMAQSERTTIYRAAFECQP